MAQRKEIYYIFDTEILLIFSWDLLKIKKNVEYVHTCPSSVVSYFNSIINQKQSMGFQWGNLFKRWSVEPNWRSVI